MQFRKHGITIIEVLTSIIIATIGVAGVMIMIPFAVSQAEQGFSQDMANQLGQNAAADFEVKGYSDTSRWRKVPSFTPSQVNGVGNATVRGYVIDPIGVAAREQGSSIPVNNYGGVFPFVSEDFEATIGLASQAAYQPSPPPAPTTDSCLLFDRLTLVPNTGSLSFFDRGLAELNFTWRDDLVFRNPTSTETTGTYASPDLAPPQQVFDVSSTGINIRRQAAGKMSYIVVSVPEIASTSPNPGTYPADPSTGCSDQVVSFRNYILLYRSRPTPAVIGTGAQQPYDRVYQVIHPEPSIDTTIANWQYKRYLTAGGTIRMSDLAHADMQASNAASTQRPEIRSGDWFALTNVYFNTSLNRFVQQINFYQVLDAAVDAGEQVVTLQGPDFDLQTAYDGTGTPLPTQTYANFGDFAAGVTNTPEYYPSKTYAIHLPDVWTVIERTYR